MAAVNRSRNDNVVRIVDRRPYRLKARAERQAQTRLRITEATVELHATVGPARTTVTAVAERAGVDRLTVYRHFPTQRDLFTACSAHAQALHPPPDSTVWASIADPERRLELALCELYAFYAANEGLLANVLRDAETMPLVRELSAPRRAYLEDVRSLLARGWNVRGGRRVRLLAAIGHALEFSTWRSLVGLRGLTAEEAAQLMTGATRSCREVSLAGGDEAGDDR